jgi:DNA-binding SARP family transcriptional activator
MATQTAVLDGVRTTTGRIHQAKPSGQTRTQVEVILLGGFQVRVDGRAIPPDRWSRRHSAALVKLLALTPGRSLHREQVIDALWPDLDTDAAAPRLHKAAHYARRTLGQPDAVVLSADTVHLCPRFEVQVDAARFQRSARSALENGGIAAAKGALALYGGVLLPHDLYEGWAAQHRLHLGRLYSDLLHQAEDWHQALAVDPSDESAHLALAHRYAESGARSAALRQLGELDQVMRDELGLEPSKESEALRRQVLVEPPETSLTRETTRGIRRPDATSPCTPCCAETSATVDRRSDGRLDDGSWS